MKTFKDIIKEASKEINELPSRTKAFVDKHVVQKTDYPVDVEDQFTAKKLKKDKTKLASFHDGEDASVYEEVDLEEGITDMPHSRLKFFATKSIPHGSYTNKEIKDEHNRRLRVEPDYHKAKASLNEAKTDSYHQHMLKALGKSRLPKDHPYTSSIANNGDFVVRDGGGRVAGRIPKGEHNLKEETMSSTDMEQREKIVKGMKKNAQDFKDRYGSKWKSVMYATATKAAMKESSEMTEAKDGDGVNIVRDRKFKEPKFKFKSHPYGSPEWHANKAAHEKFVAQQAAKKAKNAMKEESKQIDESVSFKKTDSGDHHIHYNGKPVGRITKTTSMGSSGYSVRFGGNTSKHEVSDESSLKAAKDSAKWHLTSSESPIKMKEELDLDEALEKETIKHPVGQRPKGAGWVLKQAGEQTGKDHSVWERKFKRVGQSTEASMRKEEAEQIDELSKKTLGSYVKKASYDAAGKASEYGHSGTNEPFRKASNRLRNIKKATDRLTKEEVEQIDEAFKAGAMKLNDGSSVTLTNESSNSLNKLFNQLSSSNKVKMEQRLMSGSKGFNEILAFAKEV